MAKLLLTIAAVLLLARPISAQVVITSPDGLREAEVAGTTNDALKVVCVDASCGGGGGGTVDQGAPGNPLTPWFVVGPGAVVTVDTLTSVGDTVVVPTADFTSAQVTVSGTYAGVQLNIVGFDGVATAAARCVRSGVVLVTTPVLVDNSTESFLCPIPGGSTQLVVQAAAYTSGSVSVSVTVDKREFTPTVSEAVLRNSAGAEVGVADTAPIGTEVGLVTRNIPSGTQPISGVVTVAGVATSANQTTQTTHLSSISSNTTAIVDILSSTNLLAGTLAATTTAAALGAASPTIHSVLLQSDPDNTVDMLCGDATTQPIQLKPGDAMTIATQFLSNVFCKTASGTGTINHLARHN